MRKILYCILPIFLCSILSCDRKRQSSEQNMKDSLAAANFMKCAKFLYSTFLAPSNLEEQEEYVTFPIFKKLYPLENDLVDTVCAVWLDYTIEDSCTQQSVINKDSHDIAVTALLQAYIEAKQIQLPQNPVDRYKCIDSIITNNLIPDAELEKDCGNQMQINASFNISEIWTEYLRYHYEKLLEELLKKKSISLPLQTEQEAFDKLLEAQISYFDSIGYGGGSASSMAYSQLCDEMYAIHLKGTLDLYFALQAENYKPDKVYKPISNNIVIQEYNTILHAIDSKNYYDYLDIGSREKVKACLSNEQKAWNSLMKVRKSTSRRLQGRIKSVYDNATYRLQRYHLIQLKNAFKGYGAMSNDVYSCLLSDTCSYEELLHTPNFFVKWASLLQGIDKSEQYETDFESFNQPRIFIKYKQPVNGYDVTVVCLPYNYTYDKERNTEIWGNALLCFEKKDSRFYIYNESFSDSVLYYVNEQEVRDNMILELDYLPKSKNEYLSHNSPFFFSDVDFDGEEELIINNWRCGTRHCNTYDVYKITNNEAKRLIVEPFNKIESHAEFDSINKTIILNCYNGHRESYYKKYKQINKSTSYQFNLITIGQPETDRKFTTLSDIDMGLKPKDFPDTPLIKELLDLYNSAIILYSLDHDFNLAECFDWNLKEIVNKLDCSIISNDTIREYAQNYKKVILSILSKDTFSDSESTKRIVTTHDTFAKKIIECFHVTDDMCQIYDSVVTGSIVEVEKQIKNNAVKPLIDDIPDFNKKCLYTLGAYYSNYYSTPALAIKPLQELMESKQYSIYICEIWRIWKFISENEVDWLGVPEEEYSAMKIVCLKTILAQIIQHPNDIMAINQFMQLSLMKYI